MRLSLGLLFLVSACGLPGEAVEVRSTALTTLEAGGAELSIPNGALAQDTEIVFRIVGDGKLGKDGREEGPVAPVIEILPHDVEFLIPATLTFSLTTEQTAALRVDSALTAVDGWTVSKDDDERSRPSLTRTDVDNDAVVAEITIELDGGGYFWVSHEAIQRPGLQSNLGDKDRVLVDVPELELEEEFMSGSSAVINRTAEELFGVQIGGGSPPLIASPGTQALAQMNPDQRLGGAMTWMCIDDGPAEASATVTFQWTGAGGAIQLREYRAVECYEEAIIIDPIDVLDLCPEPDGDAVISAEFESDAETDSLMVWDEGACQTVLTEVRDGVEQVWFRSRPQGPGAERARADYVLLSATLDGVAGDASSTAPRVADVGNFAVFETQADNLIGDVVDTEVAIVKFFPDSLEPAVLLRFDNNDPATTSPALSGNGQWVAAVTEGTLRVMDLRNNAPVPFDFLADSRSPEFDKSGQFLAFVTPSSLTEFDADTVDSVYLADRDPDGDDRYTGESSYILVSLLPDTTLPSTVEVLGVTAEGTDVLWIGDGSLYLTDVSGGRAATQLVSLNADGDAAVNVAEADVSADGAFVVFTTDEWSTATPAVVEAWVVDIASLNVARVSVDEDGNPATDHVTEPQIAPDGEVVALQTSAILNSSDTDDGPTVYRVPNPLGGAE
ncbi:MAG: hypothetical protein ACJAZO_005162 [Myxococcota bacterium]|jgi:hypothetical protein